MNVALHTLNTLSLCSGAGMLDRGFHAAMAGSGCRARTICYCERDPYAAALLVARMEDQALDHAPVWSDLVTFPVRRFAGCVDAIVAGIPCQGHSLAGKRKIAKDDRNLWPQTRYILRYSGAWLFALENVAGLLVPNRKEGLEAGIRRVIHDLAKDGWVGRWGTLRASDVGAAHKRERVFMLAVRHGAKQWQSIITNSARRSDQDFIQRHPREWLMPEWRGHGSLAKSASLPRISGQLLPIGEEDRRTTVDGAGDELACEFCGYVFDRELLGRYGCPNCEGQGLADDHRLREPQDEWSPQGWRRNNDIGGGELAYRLSKGSQGDQPAFGHAGDTGSTAQCGGGIPLFAPARNDFAEWLRILRIDPTLVPAVRRRDRGAIPGGEEESESALRRVFNGLAAGSYPGVQDDRADRLRVCGNGVVWMQAAVAYAHLLDRLMNQGR